MPNEQYLDANGLNQFFVGVKSYIDEHGGNNGGTLLNSLNRQLAVTQSQWQLVDGVYQCTVPCDGVIANEVVQNIYSTPASAQQSACEECGVKCIEQKENALVYQAGSLPPDLLMYVTIVNASETTSNLIEWSPEMIGNAAPAPYVASGGSFGNSNYYLFFTTNTSNSRPGLLAGAYLIFDTGKPTCFYGISTSKHLSNYTWPRSVDVEGSADGASWTKIQTCEFDDKQMNIADKFYSFMFNSPVAYRYYKFSNFLLNTGSYSNMLTSIKFLRPASDVEEAT